ncbi:MAG: hypothetical protein IJQ03_04825 [Firmicutes bacterium]|nr:hypothetical protein [Bacillota bacterium]
MENYDTDDALILRPEAPDCAKERPRPGCGGCRPPRCPDRRPDGSSSEGCHGNNGCRPPRCREERSRRRAGLPCGDPFGAAFSDCPPPCLGRLTGERPCCGAALRRCRGAALRLRLRAAQQLRLRA